MDPDFWSPHFRLQPEIEPDAAEIDIEQRYAQTPSPVLDVPEPVVVNEEADSHYDWDREYEDIFGYAGLDSVTPQCKEMPEDEPDEDDPYEPKPLTEFDLQSDMPHKFNSFDSGSLNSRYVSESFVRFRATLDTEHDVSGCTTMQPPYHGSPSDINPEKFDASPGPQSDVDNTNSSNQLKPAFYDTVPTKKEYNRLFFKPPAYSFDPTPFFEWLRRGPWEMMKGYLFPDSPGIEIPRDPRNFFTDFLVALDKVSFEEKRAQLLGRRNFSTPANFKAAKAQVLQFMENLKYSGHGKTTAADIPDSYIRDDLQALLPAAISEYLVPIDVRNSGMDFYYSSSIAMFGDPFCSHALKMSVMFSAIRDRSILPKYASLVTEEVEKVWENMWAAQHPTKTEIFILSDILKRRINVFGLNDGEMDSGVFYDADPMESKERHHLTFVKFQNSYYPLVPKKECSTSVGATSSALLNGKRGSLGFTQPAAYVQGPPFNLSDKNNDATNVASSGMSFNLNQIVLNTFSGTELVNATFDNKMRFNYVVPDPTSNSVKTEFDNANVSLFECEEPTHSVLHASLKQTSAKDTLERIKETPAIIIKKEDTGARRDEAINSPIDFSSEAEVPNFNDTTVLSKRNADANAVQTENKLAVEARQATEDNSRNIFRAFRHLYNRNCKYYYFSDQYKNLQEFPLVQHVLKIQELCLLCSTFNKLQTSVCDHNMSEKQSSYLALRDALSSSVYGNFISSEYATHQKEHFLTSKIASKLPGWTVISSKPDGNCWYNAVSSALVGDQYLGKTLRTCAYLAYLARIAAGDETMAHFSKKEVADNLLTDGAWVRAAGMYLTSEVVGRKIIVYKNDGEWWTGTYYDANECETQFNPPIYILLEGNHFSALSKNSLDMTPQPAYYTPADFRKPVLKKQELLNIIKGTNRSDEYIPLVNVSTDEEDIEAADTCLAVSRTQSDLQIGHKTESGKLLEEPKRFVEKTDSVSDKSENDSLHEPNITQPAFKKMVLPGFKPGRFTYQDEKILDEVIVLIKNEVLQLANSGNPNNLRQYAQDLVHSSTIWRRNVGIALKGNRHTSKRENKNTTYRFMKLQRHEAVQKMVKTVFDELSLQNINSVYEEALREKYQTDHAKKQKRSEESEVKTSTSHAGNIDVPQEEILNRNSENHLDKADESIWKKCSDEENPVNIKVEENSDNTDLDDDPIDEECAVSRDVLCSILKCSAKDLKYQPPMEFSFVIPSEKMANCFDYDNQNGRFIPGNWVHTFSQCLTAKQQTCSFSARSDPFYSKKLIVKGNSTNFCKFRGYCRCGMSFIGTIKEPPKPGNDCTITMKSYGVFHLLQDKSTSRQIRGKQRLEIAEKLKSRNAKTLFLNNMLHLPALRNLHNNHHQISQNVLRKIRSQETSKMRRHRDADKEIIHLKQQFIREDTSKGPIVGFIHTSNTSPEELAVWMYEPNALKLHTDQLSRGNLTTVHIDATGGVCSNRSSKQILLYVAHAVTEVNGTKISYPLAECLTECHSQLGISRFLENVKLDMKKFGHPQTKPFANMVVCDYSYAMLHGISRSVNDETLTAYINRAYKFLYEGGKWDSSKSTIFICSSHILKAFQRNLYRKLSKSTTNKKIVELAMYGIARLQESASLKELSKNICKLVRTFGLKQIPEEELRHNTENLKQKNYSVQSLEDTEGTECDESVELVDISTEQDIKLLRESSPFYHFFKKTRQLPKNYVVEDNDDVVTNPYYCPTVINTLETDYMSLWPIWSNAIEQKKGYTDFLRMTNSAIESEFNIRKQVYKTGRGRLYSDYVRESKPYNQSKLMQAVNSLLHVKKNSRATTAAKQRVAKNSELKNEKWQKRPKPRTSKYFTPKEASKITSNTTENLNSGNQSRLRRRRPKERKNDQAIVSPKPSYSSTRSKTEVENSVQMTKTDHNIGSISNIFHDHKYFCVPESNARHTSPLDVSSTQQLLACSKNGDAPSLMAHASTNAENIPFGDSAVLKSHSMANLCKTSLIDAKTSPPDVPPFKDSKFGHRFGLPNVGNTCYLNSVLQMIMSIPEVRVESSTNATTLSKYCDAIYKPSSWNQHEHLKTLKVELDVELPQFRGNDQHDALELLLALMNNESLSASLPTSAKLTLNKALMCTCGNLSLTEENEFCICIPPATSVADGIRFALMDETIDYKCECGSNEVTCRREVSNSPNSLFVAAKIFDNFGQKKCNFKTFDRSIVFGSNETGYELKSVITHHGTRIHGGHYTAYLYENDKLYCINDEIVDNVDRIMGDPYLFLYCKK